MRVAEHIVRKLVEEGVEVLFTVPGEQMDALFGALADTDIRVIHTRHEQGAAFMAYGYARSTRKIGVYTVISGPGVLNSTAALATAYAGDARILCLASEIPSPLLGRGYGVPHEVPDQLGILRRLTGWAERVGTPAQIDAVLGEAFHRLRWTRPRPVAVEVPTDVWGAEAGDPHRWTGPAVDQHPDAAAVEAAAALLASAKAPLIMVGSGARGAAAEIQRLAERLRCPVTADMGGRGIVGDRHELSVTLPVAHRLWAETDVVLGIGTRLMRPQVEWGLDDNLQIIRVDLDPTEIDRVRPPAVPLVADATLAVRALLDRVDDAPQREDWLARVKRARDDVEAEAARLVPQVDFLRAMRAVLPDDGFFVDELTQVGYVSRFAFPIYAHSTYVPVTYQGALGSGFATALGVQAANPGRPVLSISGDGGFLYTAVELSTAVQQRLPVVAVVFNDRSYANVSRSQLRSLGATVGTDLHNPDFPAFAKAFGAYGVRATTPDELAAEISAAFGRPDAPTVIEVPVGEMPSPWPLIRLPRVR
ncbi:thiamine pyrophosphate-dependent enzyme [Polymorphospora lycopeni]|uniref:Thiamine pyrophosphate-dependent enzyme n=1 Tax=Polymorphospora lycopeni TaxID=3140240 RepID=A0ABV5CVS7_9ACTN